MARSKKTAFFLRALGLGCGLPNLLRFYHAPFKRKWMFFQVSLGFRCELSPARWWQELKGFPAIW
jgi:hypothetical protein